MPHNLLLAIVSFIVVLETDILTDYGRWLTKRDINHDRGFWIRAVGLLIPAFFLLAYAGWRFELSWPVAVKTLSVLFLLGSWFIVLFNCHFNIIRNYPWHWRGTVHLKQSKIDAKLRSLTVRGMAILYLSLILSSTFFYVISVKL